MCVGALFLLCTLLTLLHFSHSTAENAVYRNELTQLSVHIYTHSSIPLILIHLEWKVHVRITYIVSVCVRWHENCGNERVQSEIEKMKTDEMKS